MAENPIDPFAPPLRDANGNLIRRGQPRPEDTQELPVVPIAPDHGQWAPPPPQYPPAAEPPQYLPPSAAPPPPAPLFNRPPPPPDPSPVPGFGGHEPVVSPMRPLDDQSSEPDTDAPRRSGTVRVLAVSLAVVALVLGVGFAVVYTAGDGDDPASASDQDSGSPEPSDSPSPEASETPSDDAQDDTESPEPEPSSEADDGEAETGTAPSRPTKFGAWWAGEGVYEAKWEEPSDDGGLAVTSYLVTDCTGVELKTVEADTYNVKINTNSLDCMSVQAVNDAGAGQVASMDIESG